MAGNHRANLRVELERASGDRRLEKFLWLEVRVMLNSNPVLCPRVLCGSLIPHGGIQLSFLGWCCLGSHG